MDILIRNHLQNATKETLSHKFLCQLWTGVVTVSRWLLNRSLKKEEMVEVAKALCQEFPVLKDGALENWSFVYDHLRKRSNNMSSDYDKAIRGEKHTFSNSCFNQTVRNVFIV
jgi:hypothetical protein